MSNPEMTPEQLTNACARQTAKVHLAAGFSKKGGAYETTPEDAAHLAAVIGEPPASELLARFQNTVRETLTIFQLAPVLAWAKYADVGDYLDEMQEVEAFEDDEQEEINAVLRPRGLMLCRDDRGYFAGERVRS